MVRPLESSALVLGAQVTNRLTSVSPNGSSKNGRVKRWGSGLQAVVTTPLVHLLFEMTGSHQPRDVHGLTFKNGPSPAQYPTASFVSSVTSQESIISMRCSPAPGRTVRPYHGASCGACGSIVSAVVGLSQLTTPKTLDTTSPNT